MGFTEVIDLNADVTIAIGGVSKKTGKKNPVTVEGYYLGCRKIEDRKKKSGVSYIYILQTAQGNVGVWGKTDMDRKMQNVTPGVMTRITFDKMVPTTNGDMYKYKVAVDAENKIEVGFGNSAADSDAEYSTASYDEDDNNTDDEDSEFVPFTTSSTTDAERKAKVQALLKKTNKTA